MTLSLRKARRLEQGILDRINQENKTDVSFSVFADVPNLDELQKSFLAELNIKRVLNAIRHNIRDLISVTNQSSGLNALIGKEAGAKSDIRLLQNILRVTTRDITQEQLASKHTAKLAMANNSESRFGYGNESMDAAFVTTHTLLGIKGELNEAKKIQQGLADEMLSINMTAVIVVSVDDESTLKELGLL